MAASVHDRMPPIDAVGPLAPTHHTSTTNSLGHQLSHAAQLDGHFLKCQPEYEAMVRAVGIQPGWHVLDAGSGTGSFLPLLAELVGPTGKITAVDMAPENRASAQQLVDTLQLDSTVTIQAGDITQLSFAENTFDAVWCAYVSQYLTNEQFATMLQEMLRVVKPGGLIGIKEFDMTAWQYQPTDPNLMARLVAKRAEAGLIQTNGCLRPLHFRSWYLRAGLQDVWLKSFVSETVPPIDPMVKEFLHNLLIWLAGNARDADLSAEDLAVWQWLGDIHANDHILNLPDFYERENHILAVGTKPTAT